MRPLPRRSFQDSNIQPRLAGPLLFGSLCLLSVQAGAQSTLFPDLQVEREVRHVSASGEADLVGTIRETYGGHWMVRSSASDPSVGDRTIVDFRRREITQVKGRRYSVIGFERLASLREELLALELGDETVSRLDRVRTDRLGASQAAADPGLGGTGSLDLTRLVPVSEVDDRLQSSLASSVATSALDTDSRQTHVALVRQSFEETATGGTASATPEIELEAWLGAEQLFSPRAQDALVQYRGAIASTATHQSRRALLGGDLRDVARLTLQRQAAGRLIQRTSVPAGDGSQAGWTVEQVTELHRLERPAIQDLVQVPADYERRPHPIEGVVATLRALRERERGGPVGADGNAVP